MPTIIQQQQQLKMGFNYFEEETKQVKSEFNLDVVLDFQMKHDVQIIRGEDYMYHACIEKVAYGSSITPMHALWFGIKAYNGGVDDSNGHWLTLDNVPPNELVEVRDAKGNIAIAEPCYYPFEIVKQAGDEKKSWGWRGTPVFFEDGKERWDGSWLVMAEGLSLPNIETIVEWRPLKAL